MRPAAFPFLAVVGCLAGAAHAQEAVPEPASAATETGGFAMGGLAMSGLAMSGLAMSGAPLLLRIRPRDEVPEEGSGVDAAAAARQAEAARQVALARAVAAREAFEARITARANRAIASVCTGCLGPVPPSVALTPPVAVAAPVRPTPVAMTDP